METNQQNNKWEQEAMVCNCQYEQGHGLTCPLYEAPKNPEEQRWWEEKFDKDYDLNWENMFELKSHLKHFIKQVEDKAIEEDINAVLDEVIKEIKSKGLYLGYANNIIELINNLKK